MYKIVCLACAPKYESEEIHLAQDGAKGTDEDENILFCPRFHELSEKGQRALLSGNQTQTECYDCEGIIYVSPSSRWFYDARQRELGAEAT